MAVCPLRYFAPLLVLILFLCRTKITWIPVVCVAVGYALFGNMTNNEVLNKSIGLLIIMVALLWWFFYK